MPKEAKHDFRYKDDAGVELEAYQVTAAGRWATQDWPDWLNVASSAEQTNAVYTDPAAPNSLFINLPEGRFQIEEGAYIVFENGQLSVRGQAGFESVFEKVVPVPPRNLDPESAPGFEREHKVVDGKLVKLSPEEIAELPPQEPVSIDPTIITTSEPDVPSLGQESDLRPKAEIAFELMQEGNIEAGVDTLRKALSDETKWCNCPPGQCANGPRWGCRENSPLVRKP